MKSTREKNIERYETYSQKVYFYKQTKNFLVTGTVVKIMFILTFWRGGKMGKKDFVAYQVLDFVSLEEAKMINAWMNNNNWKQGGIKEKFQTFVKIWINILSFECENQLGVEILLVFKKFIWF